MSDENEHKIRDKAYAIWEKEGYPEGRDSDHWHQAVKEVTEVTEVEDTKPQEASPASRGGKEKSQPQAIELVSSSEPKAKGAKPKLATRK